MHCLSARLDWQLDCHTNVTSLLVEGRPSCAQQSLASTLSALAVPVTSYRHPSRHANVVTSADYKRGRRKGATSKNVKNRQKVSKIFSTLFDNFRAGQKTSKIVKKCQKVFRHFSTIFARHLFSGPFCNPLITPCLLTPICLPPCLNMSDHLACADLDTEKISLKRWELKIPCFEEFCWGGNTFETRPILWDMAVLCTSTSRTLSSESFCLPSPSSGERAQRVPLRLFVSKSELTEFIRRTHCLCPRTQ